MKTRGDPLRGSKFLPDDRVTVVRKAPGDYPNGKVDNLKPEQHNATEAE